EFALPLEGQVCWRHDQDVLGQSPQLQFADKETCHDRFACTGVVGQQEPHAGKLEEVVVHSLELVRQWVDTRDGQAEVRIVFPCYAECISLEAQTEQAAVPPVRAAL